MHACFFVYLKVFLCTCCVCCYFMQAKIADVYVCMESVYAIVVFVNADNLHYNLNFFPSSIFSYFYMMLHNSFCQFLNNLYYVLKYFVDMQILYTYNCASISKPRPLIVRKYVGNLMLHSQESRKTFKIQNNSIYETQFIQFVQYLDTNMAKKVNTHTSCALTQLQMNYKRSFNKAIVTTFCGISFKYFRNYKNIKSCISIVSCIFNSFCIHRTYKVTRVHLKNDLEKLGKCLIKKFIYGKEDPQINQKRTENHPWHYL